MASRGLVGGYQSFGETACLSLQTGDSRFSFGFFPTCTRFWALTIVPYSKKGKQNYGNEISYSQVSGREALKLIFGLGRSYFQPWNIYVVNIRGCTDDQFRQKEKIENIKEKYNKIFWNIPENV
jgi:hypothetical protein